MKYFIKFIIFIVLFSCGKKDKLNQTDGGIIQEIWEKETIASIKNCCSNESNVKIIEADYKRLMRRNRAEKWNLIFQNLRKLEDCNIYIEEEFSLAYLTDYRVIFYTQADTFSYIFQHNDKYTQHDEYTRTDDFNKNFVWKKSGDFSCCEPLVNGNFYSNNYYVIRSNLNLCADTPKIHVLSHQNFSRYLELVD